MTRFAPGGLKGTPEAITVHSHASSQQGGLLTASAFGGKHPFTTTVKVLGATGAVTTANILSGPLAGPYLVTVYVEVTAKTTNGIITVTIGWTDAVGATTETTLTAFTFNATGRGKTIFPIEVASGDVTYAVGIGTFTGTYNCRVLVESLA